MVPLAFYLGMLFQFHAGPDINQLIAPALFAGPVKTVDLGTLNQIFDLMQRNYATPGMKPSDTFNYAAKGMSHNLAADLYKDNFSNYFTPEELKQNQDFLAGVFAGIGATMQNCGGLVVEGIVPNSPAAAAGLKPRDVVIQINGQDATGLSVTDAVTKIRGPAGTSIKLTVNRGGKTVELTITRQQIKVPSVKSKDVAPAVLYIRVTDFGQDTAKDFHDQLDAGIKRGDRSIVLDLRRNPGGYVSAADQVISEFVQTGETVTLVSRASRDVHRASGKGIAFTQKLAVLVDENSASASEITAGALQDHNRGQLVGKKTFGKGLVEQDYPLRNGGDLHLTVAFWLRPSGKTINALGVTPDRPVELANPQSTFWEVDGIGCDGKAFDPAKDTQLQAALAALR